MNEAYKGDFIGMEYNGVHSSALGYIRTSNSDRYTNSILPTFEDRTVQVVGGDGTYYFGADYSAKEIPIPIAFDEINEYTWRNLIKLFGDKYFHKLILDEHPYKYYLAKVSQSPEFEYLCFNDENNQRVYKGEAELSFINYTTYGLSIYKYLSDFTSANMKYWDFIPTKDIQPILNTKIYYHRNIRNLYTPIIFTEGIEFPITYTQCTSSDEFRQDAQYYIKDGEIYTEVTITVTDYNENPSMYYLKDDEQYYEGGNINEWFFSTHFLKEQGNYDRFISGSCDLYNPGDLEADYEVTINFSGNNINNLSFYITDTGTAWTRYQLKFNPNIEKKGNDTAIVINSKNQLVYGVNNGVQTGTIYNEYIIGGNFFKIPINYITNENDLDYNTYTVMKLILGSAHNATIKYDYKFL